jgi:hypothetical protein
MLLAFEIGKDVLTKSHHRRPRHMPFCSLFEGGSGVSLRSWWSDGSEDIYARNRKRQFPVEGDQLVQILLVSSLSQSNVEEMAARIQDVFMLFGDSITEYGWEPDHNALGQRLTRMWP